MQRIETTSLYLNVSIYSGIYFLRFFFERVRLGVGGGDGDSFTNVDPNGVKALI